jgi:aspartate kinase
MSIIVQKFGGTSVGTPERIKAVAEICTQTKKREKCNLVVVVSAMGDTTDDLVTLMNQVTDYPTPRELDVLLSTGEQVSIALLSMAIQKAGYEACSLTGWQAGISTESVHSKARIKSIDTKLIKKLFAEGKIVVVAGFQGIAEGEITTLGRGGSDTSAVALAAALKADRCDIYTDVDGVHTTDPRIVDKTGRLKFIAYDEMLELASLGAQVLHPRSVEIAKNFEIPLRVRSSWKPEDNGTLVVNNPVSDDIISNNFTERKSKMIEGQRSVRGVALDRKQSRLSIIGVPDEPGIACKIFSELSHHGVSVDVIVQCVSHDGHTEVDFTVNRDQAEKAKQELDIIAKSIKAQRTAIDNSVVKVSVVGAGMIDQPGVAAKMFKALGDHKINIQMISTSEIRISCIVHESQGEEAVKCIHEAFGLSEVNS